MNDYLVTGVSRRKASAVNHLGNEVEVLLRANAPTLVCGDRISIQQDGGTFVLDTLAPRKNLLSRSFHDKTKLLASNLDRLYIVTAVTPLFNTVFLDRIITASTLEGIPFSIVINKTDLGLSGTESSIEIYRSLGFTLIFTCAKQQDGIQEFLDELDHPDLSTVALCGISGVGKSTLLNRFVPNAQQHTLEVSHKTGQGKQTTSMAIAHMRLNQQGKPQFIIDLPGLQHFGISQLSLSELRDTFNEFISRRENCKFQDCSHTNEPSCAILDAVRGGQIALSRYNSYLHMREEIISAQPY